MLPAFCRREGTAMSTRQQAVDSIHILALVSLLTACGNGTLAPSGTPRVPPPTSAQFATATQSSLPPSPAPISTLASTTATPAACKNDAVYLADVTIPDGTVLAPGATRTKTWRIKNTGTCAWDAGYQFVFISGDAMTAQRVMSVPTVAPGATVDLSIPLSVPTNPGAHTGAWQMRAPDGGLFGVMVTVKISVSAPAAASTNTPLHCKGTPEIEAFFADAKTIPQGGGTTLRWGTVTNADNVEIDHGIGGVAAGPLGGSTIISPTVTTTYTMTAYCLGTTTTLQVTISVSGQ